MEKFMNEVIDQWMKDLIKDLSQLANSNYQTEDD